MPENEWMQEHPDWDDAGKHVEALMENGTRVIGNLFADPWFNGEDEIPIFSIISDDGDETSFYDCRQWRIVE